MFAEQDYDVDDEYLLGGEADAPMTGSSVPDTVAA